MIVAGFGFRGAATADSLRDALGRAAGNRRVDALAAPVDKAGAACLIALAQSLFLPIRGITPAALVAEGTVTEAPRVRALRGTGSVAEAAALAAAGPGARLLSARCVSGDRMAAAALAASAEEVA